MKKVFVATAALLAFGAGTAFAAYECDSKTINNLPIKLSKNVCMDYAAGTGNTGYVAGTSHNKGTKTYGSSSGDAKVYEKAGTGQSLPNAPAGTASATWASGWAPL